ncbi:helix-turn-helix transcriptional regulator [Sphingomonas azotifigens]|uniref:helix-turn-helix transcriptional regulator n=1 Tax=Sphingomonas azotifigens TaxID=330920 RepID=UPI0009FF1C8F|nr:helix-turn-helix transcriptional regulator [Sphingomonas azotifigens]
MTSEERRKLLGSFIRSHRERMKPEVVVRRRRTPGLRREELAALAGIGVTWCAWIEQGREVSVSAETLSRIAEALALTPAERCYLFELGGRRDPAEPMISTVATAPASVAALVGTLSVPAYGLDRLWNASCWNSAAERLFTGWLGPCGERNLLRYTFLSPSAKMLLPDWEQRARRVLAEFRADCVRRMNDPFLDGLAKDLRARSELFAQEWDSQSVSAREGGIRTFVHPLDGPLSFSQHTFNAGERPDHKLVALMPV